MMNLFLIALGGAIGSALRYLTSEIVTNFVKLHIAGFSRFPIGTFFVNVTGSLLAGILYFLIIKNFNNLDLNLKNFLLVGCLGGFTTFSAFSLDFFRLFTAGQHLSAIAYATTSVIISILALFFGFNLTRLLFQ